MPTDDLLKRLREAGNDYTVAWGTGDLYDKAADEVERLTRERDEWAAKWQRMSRKYAELRWPGLTRIITGKDAEAPHHCSEQDIDALVRWLDAINDPEQHPLPSLEDTDWRGRAGVIAKVIRHLRDTPGVETGAPGQENT